MKKIKYIMMIAGFAAMGCGQPKTDFNVINITNNCQELKEYIYQDIANDAVLGDVAETYIDILNEIIELNGHHEYATADYYDERYESDCCNCDEID